jgi:hypothetical protein
LPTEPHTPATPPTPTLPHRRAAVTTAGIALAAAVAVTVASAAPVVAGMSLNHNETLLHR